MNKSKSNKILKIMFQVRQTKRQLAKTSMQSSAGDTAASQNTEERIALIVMVVVTLFIICQITESIFWILARSFSVTGFTLMTCLNSSVNPVVYGVFSEKYRKLFVQMFLPCINKEKKSQYVVAGER